MIEFIGIVTAAISAFWFFLYQQNKKIRKVEVEKVEIQLQKKALEVENEIKNMSDDDLANAIRGKLTDKKKDN